MAVQTDDAETEGRLDLVISRDIDAPRALVWKAWTNPEHLKKWWAPAPVTTPECEMDVRPGGKFRTVMRTPDGAEYPTNGCFLEVVPLERITFTDALEAGFRPTGQPFFTAVITFEDHEGGTRYTARAMHKDGADREKHEKMGFYEGWGTNIRQLAAVAESLKKAGS
jgi:uncharacterized protein YndB with AHSA1/START domain